MNFKKGLLLLSSIGLTASNIFYVVSCSSTNNSKAYLYNSLKEKLNLEISKNLENQNLSSKNIKLNLSNTNSINLFNIFNNETLISTIFTFDNSVFKIDENYEMNVEFDFSTIDSWNENLTPTISLDNKRIIVPALISLYDFKNNISVQKYINLFELYIEDTIINDGINEKYEGTAGKKIVFSSFEKDIDFQAIPKDMIDKYLSFIKTSNKKSIQKPPIYQNKNDELKEWKGKTLSEVMKISGAIEEPANYYDETNQYSYSIVNSFFAGENREHAYFVMKFSLYSKQYEELINDAKNLYELSFEKEYTVFVNSWEFAKPNESDINNYVENNKELMSPLIENAKTNSLTYKPIVLINKEFGKTLEVEQYIERFNKGVIDFKPPEGFEYISPNGQKREISFEIISLEALEGSEEVVVINISMQIDKGDLKTSETFSRNYNKKLGKFV